MSSRKLAAFAALSMLVSFVAAAHAADPLALARKVKAALEPSRPSIRTITAHFYHRSEQLIQWTGVQARGSVNGTNYMLTVFQAPAQARGMAMLTSERRGQYPNMWIYLPADQRVQQLSPVALSAPFFGTDFTYADLGFMVVRNRYRLLGRAMRDGVETYELEAFPNPERYESVRFTAWIDTQTYLPVERDFFDHDDHVWRIEYYSQTKRIQGIPTACRIQMIDRNSNNSTDFVFSNVNYDVSIPAWIFNPDQLSDVNSNPLWKSADNQPTTPAQPQARNQ